MKREERDRLLGSIQETLISTIYALQGDPGEELTPFNLGATLAHAALATIEQSGYEIVKRAPRPA